MSNPSTSTLSKAGKGTIHLALLPPNTPRLKTVKYQYPLKLVSPAPLRTSHEPSQLIHTVYLLTYGGGLVAGDAVDLRVTLEPSTKLILLTQGSTKLFKSPSKDTISRQLTHVSLEPHSALCYLPDPVQPFENSCFEQRQLYHFAVDGRDASSTASLCVLDWVCNGRQANGEDWSFLHYASKNEIYLSLPSGERRLLLRDSLLLDDEHTRDSIAHRMDGLAVYGTLLMHGSLLQNLAKFFVTEFSALTRIGGRKWDEDGDSGDEDLDPAMARQVMRHRQECIDGVTWSAASVRGCTLVKFGAKTVEGGRKWVRTMLVEEGTVVREFGERALLCLR